MNTRPWAIVLILICALTNAFSLFFIKKSTMGGLSFDVLMSPYLYLGAFAMLMGAILMIISFKGGDLTVLYPLLATTYIWMTFLSSVLLDETVTTVKWAGILSIVIGVSLIGGKWHGS